MRRRQVPQDYREVQEGLRLLRPPEDPLDHHYLAVHQSHLYPVGNEMQQCPNNLTIVIYRKCITHNFNINNNIIGNFGDYLTAVGRV